MYSDSRPCAECGAEVELRARTTPPAPDSGDHPVGPGHVVGGADDTVDIRVCTNPDCPTHTSETTP
ncbi:hypothetical protein IEQ44_11150 [Nocardioides sp. Y6]|uniref:Uncharacterized protein n=1 Tax=Nocardioides malaquae TaxID=2773426 RepID=A0ABR9RUF4_9ACTN|nr:hypothetical protein [Nocardioides malaquae]MBE7325211.1 hypothetical protein [Nocardioides malaquae]